jgi:nitrite reductase/ring-hydroxylating ferredoxin subunit
LSARVPAVTHPDISPRPTPSRHEPYFQRFRDYADKAQILSAVHRAFFDGIRRFAGRECERHCERAGLSAMHLYFPAESVGLLEEYVKERMKWRMLEWSAAIGRRDVGFRDDFLVQSLLVVRVHYPHSHIGQAPPAAGKPRLYDRLRYGLGSNLERARELYDSKRALQLPLRMLEYTRRRRKRAALPLPYRCHAPHLDSWLGQPTTGLSVWLGIAGVDEKNSMCLYPETVGMRLRADGSQFLAAGVCLPKPTRPQLGDGDLFVFNTDILHSSQLNVSDKTRIALTTRIDSGTPVFSGESLWWVERWYSADGILAGRWKRTIVRGSTNAVMPPPAAVAPPQDTRCVKIASVFRGTQPVPVLKSETLKDNQKVAIEFENARVLLLRSGAQLRAFSARCPHEGYRMDDGYHDDSRLFCPGHGLEFDIQSGESSLKRYRLAAYSAFEKEGTIFLAATTARSDTASSS